jgi:hypothetical protein
LEAASGRGGIVAGLVGDDLVVVLTEPGKPSMVARVAVQNAGLFAAEAAGQAIPGEEVDAVPLAGAPRAAIDAPVGGAAGKPDDQPGVVKATDDQAPGLDERRNAVESDSAPAGREDEHGIPPSLLEALAGLGPEDRQAITEVIVLYREFPAWAVWLPHGGRPWTAVRPASARAPGPDLPVVWTQARTATELAALMRRADAALAPG